MNTQININTIADKYNIQIEQITSNVYKVIHQAKPICINSIKKDLKECILITSDIEKKKDRNQTKRYGSVCLIALNNSPAIKEYSTILKNRGIHTCYEPYSEAAFMPSIDTIYIGDNNG